MSLNNLDTVVGVSYVMDQNASRAFSWRNEIISPLPAPPGYSYSAGVQSAAYAINNAGTIVGSFDGYVPQGSRVVMWQEGSTRFLPTPEGYDYAYVSDLNELDQAAGYVRTSTGAAHPAGDLGRRLCPDAGPAFRFPLRLGPPPLTMWGR